MAGGNGHAKGGRWREQSSTNGGGFAMDRFGRRIPKPDPTPLENARKFERLREGWNHRMSAGRIPTNAAEFTRGVGWDETLARDGTRGDHDVSIHPNPRGYLLFSRRLRLRRRLAVPPHCLEPDSRPPMTVLHLHEANRAHISG